MAPSSLSAEALLHGDEPSLEDRVEGAALRKLYWTLKGRERDLERQKAFWEATNDALQLAYVDVKEKSRELNEARELLLSLNKSLEQRVASQVEEIVKRAREVEILNSQLRLKVQERSRELLRALQQLGETTRQNELTVGQKFADRVEITRVLGKGGMGVVYLGWDLLLGKPVALKLMNAAIDMSSIKRFFAEASAVASVDHPGVVRTFHVDVTAGGHAYQIMEYAEGITLAQHLAHGPLGATVAVSLFAGLADAVAAAHAAGVVHRDIKPSNLMLNSQPPTLRILDFGISKLFSDDSMVAGLTVGNEVIGTPRYMSPEQIQRPAEVTESADVYSLGLVLFEAVAGHPPFEANNATGLYLAHLHQAPPDLSTVVTGLPDGLAPLVARCLDKSSAARPSARALADALRAIADTFTVPITLELPDPARPPQPLPQLQNTVATAARSGPTDVPLPSRE